MSTSQRQSRPKARVSVGETEINKFLIFQFGYAEAKKHKKKKQKQNKEKKMDTECSRLHLASIMNCI